MRRDPMSASRNASELAQLAREHDLTMFQAFAVFLEGWAAVSRGEPAGLDGMRRGVDLLREQNVLMFDGLLKIVLAETEAAAAMWTAPSRCSTERWRRLSGAAIGLSCGSSSVAWRHSSEARLG